MACNLRELRDPTNFVCNASKTRNFRTFRPIAPPPRLYIGPTIQDIKSTMVSTRHSNNSTRTSRSAASSRKRDRLPSSRSLAAFEAKLPANSKAKQAKKTALKARPTAQPTTQPSRTTTTKGGSKTPLVSDPILISSPGPSSNPLLSSPLRQSPPTKRYNVSIMVDIIIDEKTRESLVDILDINDPFTINWTDLYA